MFSRRQPTLPDGASVWILLIVAVMTLIVSNCNALPLQDQRVPDEFDGRLVSPRDLSWLLYQTDDSMPRVRRGHRYMSDAGYGSRVSAASKVASALTAHHDLFGSFGPGRKKRPSSSGSDVIERLLRLYNAEQQKET